MPLAPSSLTVLSHLLPPALRVCLFLSVACRGLAHVAGFVLIVMGLGSEEEAFWVVTTLLEDKVFGYCSAQVGGALYRGAVGQ